MKMSASAKEEYESHAPIAVSAVVGARRFIDLAHSAISRCSCKLLHLVSLTVSVRFLHKTRSAAVGGKGTNDVPSTEEPFQGRS